MQAPGLVIWIAVFAVRIGAVAFAVLAFSFHHKPTTEVAFLERHFGDRYTDDRMRVRRLVPLLW
jgi:protein-S-isoprenylcysteine O-methyltransferase Ste14